MGKPRAFVRDEGRTYQIALKGTAMKPWVKATKSGKLYVDTNHPEYIKWFTDWIIKNAAKCREIVERSKRNSKQ